MTTPKSGRGLGRGLSSIITQTDHARIGFITVALSALSANKRQPRHRFDDAQLQELAHSLKENGMLQPIVVRPDPNKADKYEIIAGERRFRAAKAAGLKEVPIIVRHTEDNRLLMEALVENIHRADLDPIEEANAYNQLIADFGYTHQALAESLGRSRTVVTNSLRLLELSDVVQDLISTGALRSGHARALVPLPKKDQQEIAALVVAEQLSVRQTEELAKRRLEGPVKANKPKATSTVRPEFKYAIKTLSDTLETDITIKGTPKRGRIEITFSGAQDLERIIELISGDVEDL